MLKVWKEMPNLNSYNIWVEGYAATGDRGIAQRITSAVGESFKDACIRANQAGKFQGYGNFDEKSLTLWGCRLFDNEYDARMSYG